MIRSAVREVRSVIQLSRAAPIGFEPLKAHNQLQQGKLVESGKSFGHGQAELRENVLMRDRLVVL
jgi:hypothetical protein